MRVQSWRQRAGLAVVLVGTATCSSAPRGPFFGDEQFLVLGVSPEEEANAVSKRLATDGRKEYLRLRGPSFTALGFEERDGRPGWVRGITQRGIELALDPVPSHALERGVRYELIVLKRSYDWDDPCVLAYRLQGTGFVDLITDGSHTLDVARDAITGVEPCVGTAPADGGVLEDPGEVEAEAEAASPKVRQEPGPEPEPAASPPQ
jgi:hypothetical protein